jgi:hypothetical protein
MDVHSMLVLFNFSYLNKRKCRLAYKEEISFLGVFKNKVQKKLLINDTQIENLYG